MSNSNWHWDSDRHRWVHMGSRISQNPTYRWELKKDMMVYSNDLMMEAIDVACSNMSDFPDAQTIISQITGNLNNDEEDNL